MQQAQPVVKSPVKVSVSVRCRPPSNRELNQPLSVSVGPKKIAMAAGDTVSRFSFDHTFGRDSTQEEVFKTVGQSAVDAFLQKGLNASVITYGQTGSGKTFTLMGPDDDVVVNGRMRVSDTHASGVRFEGPNDSDSLRGIAPRAVEAVLMALSPFRRLRENEDPAPLPNMTLGDPDADAWRLEARYLECYNDQVYDLLSDAETPLRITGGGGGAPVRVHGVTQVPVGSTLDALDVLDRGSNARVVRGTDLNERSSRSHCIFTLVLTRRCVEPRPHVARSVLHLVDLAGSEKTRGLAGATKAALSGARAPEEQAQILADDAQRFAELTSINSSLTALGQVVRALCSGARHVPYRDSKLTRLLSDALGGNSVTHILATISPSKLAAEETLSTLLFANRAKNIQVVAERTETVSDSVRAQAAEKSVNELMTRMKALEARAVAADERAMLAESKLEMSVADLASSRAELSRLHEESKVVVESRVELPPSGLPSSTAMAQAFDSTTTIASAMLPLLEAARDSLVEMLDDAGTAKHLVAEVSETFSLLSADLCIAATEAAKVVAVDAVEDDAREDAAVTSYAARRQSALELSKIARTPRPREYEEMPVTDHAAVPVPLPMVTPAPVNRIPPSVRVLTETSPGTPIAAPSMPLPSFSKNGRRPMSPPPF